MAHAAQTQTFLDGAVQSVGGSRVVQRVVSRFLERRAAGVDFDHPVVEPCDLEEAETEAARQILQEIHSLDVLRHVGLLFAN